MGAALELLTGFVTAPSTTLTALTMATGNSLTIRSAAPDSLIRLVTAWTDNQTAGILRIRSPRLHDQVQGLRLSAPPAGGGPLLPPKVPTRLHSQDTLTVELSGSGTSGDIETAAMLVYYDDLPGSQARFITPEELKARMVHIAGVMNTLSSGTAGGYSGEEAINAEFDQLKSDRDYALIGYTVTAEAAAIRWRGADTANYGVGGPGTPELHHLTSRWFIWLSEEFGVPLIPVFSANNRAGILLDCAQDEDGGDPVVTSLLAELAPAA